jgi:hypothetical protein
MLMALSSRLSTAQERGAPGARSRRSLLVAAAAAGGALATQAIVRPEPAVAAAAQLGVVNNTTAATTIRTTQAASGAKALIGVVAYTGAGGATAGLQGQSNALQGNGVFGVAVNGTGAKGVWGQSANGTGVYGQTTSTSGTTHGVYGLTASTLGRGVYGQATATSGFNYGVYGHVISPLGRAVYGRAQASSGGVGVYGQSNSSSGTGVVGISPLSNGETYGVIGRVNSFQGWAGYFAPRAIVDGDLTVTGSINSASSGVIVDHPLDPANRTLAHAYVQAPELLTVYRGTVTLDARGRRTVRLPRYFDALNRDFAYQLTAIGAPAPSLHVARKVERISFRIAGGLPGQEVSWIVTGVRRDAWAEAHPLKVDRVKSRRVRGRYLHPRAYGKPRSAAIHRVPRALRSARTLSE